MTGLELINSFESESKTSKLSPGFENEQQYYSLSERDGCNLEGADTSHENDFVIDDETGAKYSLDRKTLISCPVSFQGNFIVPSGVEFIAQKAFVDCVQLDTVELPNSIIEIGNNAFSNCTSLTRVNIPDCIIKIDGWAFTDCISLAEPVFYKDTFVRLPINFIGNYNIPSGITKIIDGAFDGCIYLTSVDINDGVSYIGNNAFKGCLSLDKPLYNKSIFAFLPLNYQGSYKIPDGIKEIAGGAFRRCDGLTTVEFPDGLLKIGAWAFFKCTKLNYVLIPDSVKEIGNYAFQNCFGLKSIVIPDGVKTGKDAFKNCGKEKIVSNVIDEEKLILCPKSFKGIFEIPYGIKEICEKAFCDCHGITSIIIPDSVQYVGENAFCNCVGLKSINFPDSIISVGDDIFAGCYNLGKPIYNKAFFVYLPSYFKGSYSIPSGIKTLSGSCFKDCKLLTGVEIPGSLRFIKKKAFSGCSKLKIIKLPAELMGISAEAFSGCSSVEFIKIPRGVSKILPYSFKDCSNLKLVSFPDNLTEIDKGAFMNCGLLENLVLPDSLLKIRSSAFENCSKLNYVAMSKNVKGINDTTFRNCNKHLTIDTTEKEKNLHSICSQTNKPLLLGDKNLTDSLHYINEFRYFCLKTDKLFGKKKMLCSSWNNLAYRSDNSVYIINQAPFVVIRLECSYMSADLLEMILKYNDKLVKFPYYYDGSEISSVNLDDQEFFNMFARAFPHSFSNTLSNFRNLAAANIQNSLSKDSIYRRWLMEKKDCEFPVTDFNEKISALSVRSNIMLQGIDKFTKGETWSTIKGEIFTLKSNTFGCCKLVFESSETAKATIVANVSANERFLKLQSIKEYLESNLLHKRSNSRKEGEISGVKVKFVNHDNFEKWKMEILSY